ncbi:MAG: membrane dipeptidase [Candidatus Rokuibacteriota bacterium]
MTRRELLGGAPGAALLAGCSGIRGRRLDGMDPRVPALLAGTISDHVGIGTDMEGGVNEVWDDYVDLPAVADLLLKQGFSPAEASKILGGNYVRVFRQVAAARR